MVGVGLETSSVRIVMAGMHFIEVVGATAVEIGVHISHIRWRLWSGRRIVDVAVSRGGTGDRSQWDWRWQIRDIGQFAHG